MEHSNWREKCEDLEQTGFIHVLLSHHILAFFYGIFLFLYELSITQEMISMIHPVLIIWSGIIVVYDIFVRRIWEKIPYRKILALFILAVSITACLTLKAGIMGNIKTWVLIILPILVVYPICFCEEDKRQENFMISFSGAWILTFFSSLISLYMFFVRFEGTIKFLGYEAFAGIYTIEDEGIESYIVLQGLYKDSGHAATYAVVSIVFSCIMFLAFRKGMTAKKIWGSIGQVFCILNILVQFSYFVLANSRGGWLSFFAGMFASVFMFVLFRRKEDKAGKMQFLKALLAAMFSVCVFGFVLINARDIMSSMSISIKEQNSEISIPDTGKISETPNKQTGDHLNDNDDEKEYSQNEKEPEQEVQKDSFERPKESGGSIGSGRLSLWKEALELFIHRPIFGDGSGNYAFYAKKYDVGERLRNGKAIHNSYLDLLVDYGVIGFVLLMGFYILCVGKVLKRLVNDGKNCEYSFFFAIAGGVVTMSASFFLSCCFVNTTAMYFSNLLLVSYLVSGSLLTDQGESKAKC